MSTASLGRWVACVALCVALPTWGQEPPKEARPARTRIDLHGDPLPKGAVARLGSVRFRHEGAVRSVAFSADGKLLAASSDGRNMVVLWERSTGRKVREILAPGPPARLRFSPSGKRLYGFSRTIHVWDVETGTDAKGLPPPPADAWGLGYSPDAREALLFQHKKKEIVRWDIEMGKELGRYPQPKGYPGAVARVGDQLLMAPQLTGNAIEVWDVAREKLLWSVETVREKDDTGWLMTFSSEGKLFAIASPPRVISVYESLTGKLIRRFEADAIGNYYSLSFSPDGRTVAASNRDGVLRLWDMESGRERVKIPAIQGWTTEVFFAPDSKSFATGGPNNAHAVLLWETTTGKPIDPFPGHSSLVSSVSFAPDGQTAATSSWFRGDPIVRLWDPQSGRLLRSLEARGSHGVSAVAFSPDGAMLAACGWFGANNVWIWDVASGRQRHALAGHEAGCNCVAFSPDGKRLASGDHYYNRRGEYEGRLCIWDVEAGKRLREIRGTPGAIQQVLFTRDGRQVVAAADGVHVYDADTGQRVGEPFQASNRIWGLALSLDGRLLATTDDHGPARLWELATRREIPLTMPGSKSTAVGFTPDGRTLVAAGSEGLVFLYHWPSGETVGKLSGHAGIGKRVFVSPDGRRLATAWNDESSALIWDVAGLVNRPLPAVARPGRADLERWWADLRNDKPGEAYKAVWRFVAVPEQALPFLAGALQPVKAPEPAAVARLIEDLDSSEFKVRERASQNLEQLGEAVVSALRQAKKGEVSAEQKRRIDQLLADLDGPVLGPEQVRAIRAVAILEQIGTAEARKLLTRLAGGAAGARLTQEAKPGLDRLKKGAR